MSSSPDQVMLIGELTSRDKDHVSHTLRVRGCIIPVSMSYVTVNGMAAYTYMYMYIIKSAKLILLAKTMNIYEASSASGMLILLQPS